MVNNLYINNSLYGPATQDYGTYHISSVGSQNVHIFQVTKTE